MLIERLRKEKEEHHNKIKVNEMNLRIKNSLFSEEIIQMMKNHKERLVQEKKKDM